MLVLKSTHEALMKSKEAQIAALNSEVAFLRSMVQPSRQNEFRISTEASAVLDGRDEAIDISEDDMTESDVQTEAALILSGQY
jgi:hypothetical protein